MKISIIIPSYERPHKVLNLLESIEQQESDNPEVVLTLDGDPSQTEKILDKKEFGFELNITATGKKLGRGKNRNHGVSKSGGELLIFFDDDIILGDRILSGHIAFHQKNPDSILVGAILEKERIDDNEASKYKSHLSKKWRVGKKTGRMDLGNLFLTAANLSMPRAVFESLNGFDPALQDCEDLDLGIRAIKQGISVLFDPDLVVFHDDPQTFSSYCKRQEDYSKSKRTVLAKNEIEQTKKAKGQFLYPFFRMKLWPWLLDHFNLFLVFPRPFRYKIYDQVVNAHFR